MSPIETLRAGGKPALARALARLEIRPDAPETTALLDAAWAAPQGHAVGLTGPPGVGKSTLIDALIRALRAEGRSVAALAVDPSSRRTGGALLGDRTRLSVDPEDQGVFVRSMAARDRLGGVATLTWPALVLTRALFDLVLVETVGVGQSETEIADLADTVVFCAQPGSGDALQFMKAGIMEIPDVALVTKADMGAPARRAVADLKGALGLAAQAAGPDRAPDRAPVSVLSCAASTGEGVPELVAALDARFAARSGSGALARARRAQIERWARAALAEAAGRRAAEHAAAALAGAESEPFRRAAESAATLLRALDEGLARVDRTL